MTPKPRNTSGQFGTKEGSQVAESPEGKPPEKPPDAYRFKRKLNVFGKDEDVDLDEEGLTRELQIKRALEKKVGDYKGGYEKAQRLIELAKADPDAFLAEVGSNPEEWARKKLATAAKLGAMTEEERELHELREYRQSIEARDAKRTEDEKANATKQKRQAITERNQKVYIEALQSAPDLPQSYEGLEMLIDAAEYLTEHGIAVNDPKELVTEARKRDQARVERSFRGLDGKGLIQRLGKVRVQQIMEAAVADWESTQNFEPAPGAPPAEPEKPAGAEREYIDEHEVTRRMRAAFNNK